MGSTELQEIAFASQQRMNKEPAEFLSTPISWFMVLLRSEARHQPHDLLRVMQREQECAA
jgi:hypothetical protein